MLKTNKPTKKEINLLEVHYKKGCVRLIRERAHTILLSIDNFSISEIARIIRREERSVRKWVNDWNDNRMSSLFTNYAENQNAAKLTKEQKEEIKQALQSPPSNYLIPGDFWSLPKFKDYITATFKIVYESERSYHYLLRYCNFSWKLPSPFDTRRDENYIKKRMAEISEEIKPLLKLDDWEVFVQDETRLNWEEETRRAWLKKGEKTTIKLERNKIGQSYFGALNQKTGKHHLIELNWQDTKNIIKALKNLSRKYPNKKICIIWDNAGWHKSKELREQLKKGQCLEHIHLINFPPYAPDENPQEHVWKYGKEFVANQHFETFDNLKNIFKSSIDKKIFDYKICKLVLR